MSWFGKPGGLLQRLTADAFLTGTWQYQNFVHGRNVQDKKMHLNSSATIRGGWNLALGLFIETFGYDSNLYASYALEVPAAGGDSTRFPSPDNPPSTMLKCSSR